MHALKRINLAWFARFVVPAACRKNVSKAEVVRTLQTRDKSEAIARRPGKLAEIVAGIDADLHRRVFPPIRRDLIHGESVS
ncbi:MAG: DUF6538 domain-containing protein [Janthinobacterium lividum]